jgi:nucleoid DNA-binding protein
VDELIQKVAEKAGISADQARSAVNTVIDFVKAKAPAIGEQVQAALSGAGGGAGDVLGKLRGQFGM